MGKYKKEIKILEVNVKEAQNKLTKMGAVFKCVKNQKIYTYDVPTIYYRYLEAMELLSSTNPLLVTTTKKKMHVILDEFSDLVNDEILSVIYREMHVSDFEELLTKNGLEIKKILLSSKTFQERIKSLLINPNKWVRLRQSNDKVELTVKHVYEKNSSPVQKVKEMEITVSDLAEANLILESMGIIRRNYQEKIRHSYTYKNAEIEIDEWPLIEPYIEIECEDSNVIEEIIDKLGYTEKEIVSLNTEQLYKRKGIAILEIPDLKF